CKDRGRARIRTTYFGGGTDKRALLDLGPGDVVDRKSRHNVAVARKVDRLPAKRNEGDDTAELGAACGENLRTTAMVECDVARTGTCSVLDKRCGVLGAKFLQCTRHDEQIGRRVVPVFDKAAHAVVCDTERQQSGARFRDYLRCRLAAQGVLRIAH